MEDEQGDAAQGHNNGVVSVLSLSEKSSPEPFIENMGAENEAPKSFEEGDGDEIMVEIVGSDVLVNGVSGEKEGCLVSGEVEEIGRRNFSEAMDGNDKGENEVGFVGSGVERDYVAISEVDAIRDESVDTDRANLVISDVFVLPLEASVEGNIGIAEESGALSSKNDKGESEVGFVGSGVERDYVAISKQDAIRDESVDTDRANLVISDVFGLPLEASVEGNIGIAEESGALSSKNDKGESEVGFVGSGVERDYVAISKQDAIRDESVDTDRANLVISDVFGLPLEASVEGNIDIAEESRALSSKNDDAGNVDRFGEDSLISGDAVVGPREVKIVDEFHGITYASHGIPYGASDIDLRDVHCVRNEPTERAVGGEIAEISEDNGVIIEIQADTEENQPSIEHIDPEIPMQSSKSPRNAEGERYLLHEGNFVRSDLVWGKVRSHPWWPGQIFDPSDASEKAVRYYKKESYLVAYFGDRTFAWLDESNLKLFGPYFSEMENQSNSESFQNAVASALDEVSRRVELGLSCSCVPRGVYGNFEARVVGNGGIREESSRRRGVDRSSRASRFEPVEFLEYVANLAPSAFLGGDRMDLVIARAQTSAFCRFKGYRCLTEFASCGGLLENDAESEKMIGSNKRKKIPKNGSQPRKKRKMGDDKYSRLSSGKKRKAFDRRADESNKRAAKPMSQNIKPSFKIGECIRRAASRLAGPTSSVKSSNDDEMEIDGFEKIYEPFSVDEVLSRLEMAARNPLKDDDFGNDTRTFFTGFRSSAVSNERASKNKDESKIGEYREEFEFDDLNDSYWTDRIFRNDAEEEKSVKSGRRSRSRKGLSDPTALMELDENVERREQEWSPAELILSFADRECVQSEINLNKTFRRFGPLMESETEVDRDSGRGRVIFKRGCDAEVALNSAEKINIFGPVVVDYQIGYSPLIPVKILPIAVPQCQEDEALMI